MDGGLVANAPDLVVLTEALRAFGCSFDVDLYAHAFPALVQAATQGTHVVAQVY